MGQSCDLSATFSQTYLYLPATVLAIQPAINRNTLVGENSSIVFQNILIYYRGAWNYLRAHNADRYGFDGKAFH